MSNKSEVRKQFLADVFTTALEGGIGYWSRALEYHWTNDPEGDALGAQDLDGFYATVIDAEGGNVFGPEDSGQYRIDQDVIVRGINRIAKAKTFYDPNGPDLGKERGSVPFLGAGTAEVVKLASRTNDAGEIDAGVADVIVQVGLFNEVVYG